MTGDVLIGLGTGAFAGAFFFGGLRWTVGRLAEARSPAFLAAGSFLVRSAVVIALFLLMMDGSLVRALAGLGGLIGIRTLIVLAARRSVDPARESTWK